LADGNSPGSGIHGFVDFPGNPRGPTRGLGFINPYEIRARLCHPRQEYIRPEIHKFIRRAGFMGRENALYHFFYSDSKRLTLEFGVFNALPGKGDASDYSQ